MRNRVRLTESQLHRVIKESVKRVIKEGMGMSNLGQITYNGVTINFELGHTLQEWKKRFGNVDPYNEQALWDVSIEELLDGTLEPQEDTVYWLINGRMYETM